MFIVHLYAISFVIFLLYMNHYVRTLGFSWFGFFLFYFSQNCFFSLEVFIRHFLSNFAFFPVLIWLLFSNDLHFKVSCHPSHWVQKVLESTLERQHFQRLSWDFWKDKSYVCWLHFQLYHPTLYFYEILWLLSLSLLQAYLFWVSPEHALWVFILCFLFCKNYPRYWWSNADHS